jgi:hypothetical protein
VGDALVRVVAVTFVDTADLGGLRFDSDVHNNDLCLARQA